VRGRSPQSLHFNDYLPPYAPELNPVEYIWAHCKHHELPNVCAKNLWDLGEGARRNPCISTTPGAHGRTFSATC
jgi:transposase